MTDATGPAPSRLEALVATHDGDALVDALVAFDWASGAPVTAPRGSLEWYTQVAVRMTTPDSVDHLVELVHDGRVPLEAYAAFLARVTADHPAVAS